MLRVAFITGAAAGAAFPGAAADRPAALERRVGGRLGVFALDTASGATLAHRADERFPMCSTFKVLAVSTVLTRVDAGREHLDRRIAYGPGELLSYAPQTRRNVRRGWMTVAELCSAALVWSDNTAANLLTAAAGGPPAVTRYARSLDDRLTRLDRYGPAMSSSIPGDRRDTTTPRAMVRDWQRLLCGDALSRASRSLLEGALVACRTGDERIRAGLPHAWRAGDKTGSGTHGTSNDVAILWPPKRAPIVVAAYLTGATAGEDARNAVLAAVGRLVVAHFTN
jgi:beta-lactamase class A